MRRGTAALCELGVLLWALLATQSAHADTVLTFKYTPAARAQVAIWIEDASGRYLGTAALTDAVAFRGIGNRPGASLMNSGYRWPYGRREGVLPVWARRRANAPGAKLFPRVIFQMRTEGAASRTVSDQSPDSYYCLQFASEKSSRDNLDAVSCATPFTSDKGRYLTPADMAGGYAEPWEDMVAASSGGSAMPEGRMQPLPIGSLYPPRMDVMRCTRDGECYDSADVERFAGDARAIMPEIDAITIATPPGDTPKSVLYSVPNSWPAGDYVAYIEVNLEGDYNDRWNDTTFPTPKTPTDSWDYYSETYGYPYRGQPSLVWKVAFKLGDSTPQSSSATEPAGRSSWNYWSGQYGQLETMSVASGDPQHISTDQLASGINRLRPDANGQRFVVQLRDAGDSPVSEPPVEVDAGVPAQPGDAGNAGSAEPAGAGGSAGAAAQPPMADSGDEAASPPDAPIGPVGDLELLRHPNKLRAHTWVMLRMRAAHSAQPLHAYQVRVATEPITDEQSFIVAGREAKNATDSREGATVLSLPTDVPEGQLIEAAIGDLAADTHYYVGVRANDELNRSGPIRVAEITTTVREFATVTPCFVASVAYGSPLASEVSVLRRVRDRYLMPHALGRSFVSAYYAWGEPLSRAIAPHPSLRAAARRLLAPLVAFAHWLR